MTSTFSASALRAIERRANHKLALLRHVEEVSGNIAAGCRWWWRRSSGCGSNITSDRRLRVLKAYPTHDQKTAIRFIDHVLSKLPFKVEKVQTDNGSEFGQSFCWHLLDKGIGHIRIKKPATPRLTDVSGTYTSHFPHPGPPFTREAPAHFERNGIHYLVTSGSTGYFPNFSEFASAADYHGPWTILGDAHPGDPTRTSFRSQISSVFKHPEKDDLYIARRPMAASAAGGHAQREGVFVVSGRPSGIQDVV